MDSRRHILRRTGVACLLLAALVAAAAAQDLSAPLGLDPAIRTGTLANGLAFYIRRNTQPERRAALRLVVQTGSVDEADDQRGLAHLVEHMAFNGSAHFKSGELVSYLESIGSRFGPDVNAYTSFDETVYMLEVPTDRDGIVARGLEALGDFAGGISLDPAEVDRERGVVIEEWRGRQGAATRMQAAQMRALFGDSRYADRLPIGLPEVLKAFPVERLRDFYRDHYRPDRMAVVAVGDFDPAEMEAFIRRYFGGLPAAAPAPRPTYPVPLHGETRYVAVSDREAQGSSVTVVHKRPLTPVRTVGEYRASVVRSLLHSMVNARFAEIARRPDAPFLRASSGESWLGRDVETFTVSARVNDGALERGLEAIAQELARLRQHGFGEAELDRAKRDLIAAYERAYNERDKSQTGGLASELVRHVVYAEPAPGIAKELELVRAFAPGITVAEMSALVRALITDDRRVVIASFPEKEGVLAATDASLREALRAGAATAVAPWRDEVTGRELLAARPTPGRVRERREIPEIGVTVLTLANGAEVWLKPTDFRNDQIAFTAYAPGGTSLASEAEYLDASLSASLVGVAGVGGFTPVDLGKVLAGRIANASAFMSTYTHGISGGSTPRDLEAALQLVYLHFTASNRDPEAFALLTRRLEASLANQAQSPGAVFGERVRGLNTMDHYAMRPMRPEDVGRLRADRMAVYYDARFRNAADFTFFFVGAFTVDEIAPLVETYLGSLPSTGRRESQARDLRLQFPAGILRETVRKGQEPRSQTAITFFSDTGLDELESHRLRAATTVLQMRLRDVLREELSGTYSVGVVHADTAPIPGYATTTVQFGSAPDNAERLTAVVLTELDRLRREGPPEADVQAVKETEKRELETALRQNGYWLNSLQAMHMLGRDPRRILQRAERADALTRENIHEAVRKYFPPDRHTVVTLMPEASGSGAAQ
ncbi:MAG: insulinase family protein [Acidobacteria bacterium]|nr:insulinase family protein [Acidobacteriota bacterium]